MVIAILMAIRLIPSFNFGGQGLRRADIVSDVVAKGASDTAVVVTHAAVASGRADGSAMPSKGKGDTLSRVMPAPVKVVRGDTSSVKGAAAKKLPKVTPIEDFSADGSALDAFRAAMSECKNRVVRIGFVGDSFIEGDLLTGDLREYLQRRCGGTGVGFVPVTSPVSKLRRTVGHTYSGWKSYSVKRRNGAALDTCFMLSGSISVPVDDNATVAYRVTNAKSCLKNVRQVDFFFINRGSTVIYATVNDSMVMTFMPPSDPMIQKITVSSPVAVSTISFDFDDVEGFYAYGASLHGPYGVQVDNFADRGSSGLQMSKLTVTQNNRFNDINPYDLIIIEYGLNVVATGTMRYTSFEDRMSAIVSNIKRCYPDASVIIMGLSDRSSNQDGDYRTMPEVKAMIRHQRAIARKAGVAYWDTFTAMGGENSMTEFVDKNWASKDYTHVSARGASVIARRLSEALLEAL